MTNEQKLRALMEHGDEVGCVNMSAFTTLVRTSLPMRAVPMWWPP